MRHNVTEKIILRAEGLTKYYGLLAAVKDLTLDIYQGEVFGLLGPNGAGKTTTINMLCGLVKPDAGQVLLASGPHTTRPSAARLDVGICPQDIILPKVCCAIARPPPHSSSRPAFPAQSRLHAREISRVRRLSRWSAT